MAEKKKESKFAFKIKKDDWARIRTISLGEHVGKILEITDDLITLRFDGTDFSLIVPGFKRPGGITQMRKVDVVQVSVYDSKAD